MLVASAKYLYGFGSMAMETAMTEEHDVERAAAYLVQEYGELASLRASLRADWFRNSGNTGSYRTWSRVAAAVLELLDKSDDKKA
jgi:hypothetical protein